MRSAATYLAVDEAGDAAVDDEALPRDQRVDAVHETISPVVTFVSDGLVIGPLIVMTGRVSKVPSLVTRRCPPGSARAG